MPHLNARAIAPKTLTAATRRICQIFIIDNIFHLLDGDFTIFNEQNDLFVALLNYQQCLTDVWMKQYLESCLTRKSMNQPNKDQRRDHLVDGKRFPDQIRTSLEGFDLLITLLQDAPFFTKGAHDLNQCQWSTRLWSGCIFLNMKEWLSSLFSIWQGIELRMH